MKYDLFGLKNILFKAFVWFLSVCSMVQPTGATSAPQDTATVVDQSYTEVLTTMPTTPPTAVEDAKTEFNNEPVMFHELNYSEFYDVNECNTYIAMVFDKVCEIDAALNSGSYTEEAEGYMQQERARLLEIISNLRCDIEKYSLWETEYYYAAKTWEFLMKRGYSKIVASAILGNMMVETSGGTLSLVPVIYDPDGAYYGLCQWSLVYKPEVADMPFEEQLEFLDGDMEGEFKTFGWCYSENFTYDEFLNMQDVEEAALAFATVYERCSPEFYQIRKEAALVAYNYFVLRGTVHL
jgi:hypothetical protein